ncbi:MAG: glycosyltransferase family 4 protein [Patescibacteria group bacterium]
MRIALLADLWNPVDRHGLWGRSFITGALADELVDRGHDVTLFSSGDSQTKARLISIVPKSLKRYDEAKTLALIKQAYRSTDQFDIIHSHIGELGLVGARDCLTPNLHTFHFARQLSKIPAWQTLLGPKVYFNAISQYMADLLPATATFLGVVYNGIYVNDFIFNNTPTDRYLFFSRIAKDKGPHLAIEVAKAANIKLDIAGYIHPLEQDYFNETIKPHLDNKTIRYLGDWQYTDKVAKLGHYRAMIHPINLPEAFGLVMVEAMAAGTPVITFRKGAASELVDHNNSGFVVDTLDEMIASVPNVTGLNRTHCRRIADRFSVAVMVDSYERLYHRMVKR